MTKAEDTDEALWLQCGINPAILEKMQKIKPPLSTPEPDPGWELQVPALQQLPEQTPEPTWEPHSEPMSKSPQVSPVPKLTPEPLAQLETKALPETRTKSSQRHKSNLSLLSRTKLLTETPPKPESLSKPRTRRSKPDSLATSKSQPTKLRPKSVNKATNIRRTKKPKLEPEPQLEDNPSKLGSKRGAKYNLRSKKPEQTNNALSILSETNNEIKIKTSPEANNRPTKRKALASTVKWISKKSKHSFHNIILSTIDTNTYHQLTDDDSVAKKLITLSNKSIKSQLERFVYEGKSFVAMTWLTVARIFEYNSDSGMYNEVKRIPERFVKLSPNIITAMHYTDSKFYLARLEGGTECKPFIEIRDICGKLLDGPIYYECSIQSIYSDDKYLYVKTSNDTIHIHRKNLFKLAHYNVNYSLFTSGPLIASWVEELKSHSNTKLSLLTATTQELVLSSYDIFSHKITQCYRFEGQSKIISIEKHDRLIIIHRNMLSEDSKYKSKIELGFLALTKTYSRNMFIHESTINLMSKIIEIKVHRDNLYLLGYIKDPLDDSNNFQVGCIYLPSLRPRWVTNVRASFHSHILPHDDNIAIIRERQQMTSIKINIDKKISECKKCKLRFLSQKDKTLHDKQKQTILSKLLVRKNEYLEAVGTSIFKIIPVKDT